jgi:hypothetical protein
VLASCHPDFGALKSMSTAHKCCDARLPSCRIRTETHLQPVGGTKTSTARWTNKTPLRSWLDRCKPIRRQSTTAKVRKRTNSLQNVSKFDPCSGAGAEHQ